MVSVLLLRDRCVNGIMNPADLQGFFIINEAKGYLMVKSVLEEKGLIDAWKYTMSAKFAVVGIEVARNRAIELMNLKTENFINIVKGIRELTEDDEYTFPPGDVFEINGKKTSTIDLYVDPAGRKNAVKILFTVDLTVKYFNGTTYRHLDLIAVIDRSGYCCKSCYLVDYIVLAV